MEEIPSSSQVRITALVKLNLLEIPVDKEPTANCLVETCRKLGELVLAAMVLTWAD